MSQAYKAAGVDIQAGNETVKRIKKHVQRTMRPEVLGNIGGFGGLLIARAPSVHSSLGKRSNRYSFSPRSAT